MKVFKKTLLVFELLNHLLEKNMKMKNLKKAAQNIYKLFVKAESVLSYNNPAMFNSCLWFNFNAFMVRC